MSSAAFGNKSAQGRPDQQHKRKGKRWKNNYSSKGNSKSRRTGVQQYTEHTPTEGEIWTLRAIEWLQGDSVKPEIPTAISAKRAIYDFIFSNHALASIHKKDLLHKLGDELGFEQNEGSYMGVKST